MNSEIKAVRSNLPRNSRNRSNSIGLLLLAACITAWMFTAMLVLFSPLPFTWIAILGNGVTISMLFIVGHDAAHDSLVTSHRLNRVIGTLAFLPALHPFSSWARSHNTKHHAWTNLKGEDPGYAPYSLAEYQGLPLYRRLLERFYRTEMGLGTFYFIELYCKDMMFPSRNNRPVNQRAFLFDRLAVCLFFMIEFGAAYWISVLTYREYPFLFAVYAVVSPFFVFVWLMGFVTFQHHTHPAIPWFDQEQVWSYFQCQVAGTTHVRFPRIFDITLLNILEHSAHHVDPLIPLYHLRTSQHALEAAYPDTIKIVDWNPIVLRKTLARCKLYDYREHRWLDFSGNPTTPRLLVMRIPPEIKNVDLIKVYERTSKPQTTTICQVGSDVSSKQ